MRTVVVVVLVVVLVLGPQEQLPLGAGELHDQAAASQGTESIQMGKRYPLFHEVVLVGFEGVLQLQVVKFHLSKLAIPEKWLLLWGMVNLVIAAVSNLAMPLCKLFAFFV